MGGVAATSSLAQVLAKARNNLDLPRQFVASTISAREDRRRFAAVESYCMFIGYPRSGHSLVGSLLDAHPAAVIAHELDVLRLVHAGFRRSQILSLILRNSQSHGPRRQHVYDYTVPNQWQGRFRRIRVIGDKKGGRSTRRLAESPALLARLQRRVGVPTRFVHVLRNPFDNVATMFKRASEGTSLASTVDTYSLLCHTVATVKSQVATSAMLDVRHEDLLGDPSGQLRALCGFVGLDATTDYVADCASILYANANQTRHQVDWTSDLVDQVGALIARYRFLAGYSFGS